MLRICFTLLCVILINAQAKNDGIKRFISKMKRQATTTTEECYNFEWVLDSTSKKYYSCCSDDNLESVSTCTNTLDSTSSNYECNPYGEDIYKKNITSKYNCGRCEGKQWAMEKCNARWNIVGIDETTDRCWIWSECFKGACAAQEVAYLDETKSVPQETNFCGDGFCLKSTGETVDNCPIDCCPEENSACAVTSEECPDACCNESKCCIESLSVLYIGIICGAVALINLMCCCCCLCCYRKIKRVCGCGYQFKSKNVSLDDLSRSNPSPKSNVSKTNSLSSLNRKGYHQNNLSPNSNSLNRKGYHQNTLSPNSNSLNRKGYPQSNLSSKSNSLASLNKKVYYVTRGDQSPRPSHKSSSLTSLNKKGLSRSTMSLDRIV